MLNIVYQEGYKLTHSSGARLAAAAAAIGAVAKWCCRGQTWARADRASIEKEARKLVITCDNCGGQQRCLRCAGVLPTTHVNFGGANSLRGLCGCARRGPFLLRFDAAAGLYVRHRFVPGSVPHYIKRTTASGRLPSGQKPSGWGRRSRPSAGAARRPPRTSVFDWRAGHSRYGRTILADPRRVGWA